MPTRIFRERPMNRRSAWFTLRISSPRVKQQWPSENMSAGSMIRTQPPFIWSVHGMPGTRMTSPYSFTNSFITGNPVVTISVLDRKNSKPTGFSRHGSLSTTNSFMSTGSESSSRRVVHPATFIRTRSEGLPKRQPAVWHRRITHRCDVQRSNRQRTRSSRLNPVVSNRPGAGCDGVQFIQLRVTHRNVNICS